MAFMMPVVKRNYALYATPSGSSGAEQRQRRTSDQLDGRGNPKLITTGPSGVGLGRRRKAKSEGQSLSTSPGTILSSGSGDGGIQRTKPVEMGMRRGRGSAPVLVPAPLHSFSLQHSSRLSGNVRPSTSAPTGNSPVHGSSQSHSSISSSTSSSDSNTTGKKFHSKLVMRLRKTFRIKDPEPTST